MAPFPTAESYWLVPGYALFWTAVAIAVLLFGLRVYKLGRLLRLGKAENRWDKPWLRLKTTLGIVLAQVCSLRSLTRRDFAGLGHALIFWGFIVFMAGYVVILFIGQGFGIYASFQDTAFARGYFAVADIAGAVVLVAVLWAGIRRYLLRPERLERTWDALICLGLIFFIMASYFFLTAFELNGRTPAQGSWSLLSRQLAGALAATPWNLEAQRLGYIISWWVHLLLILVFLVYIPHSKHLHIIVSPFNIFFRSSRPRGTLRKMDLEAAEVFGAASVRDFTWKQLLDAYACTRCGRCQVSCPAWSCGKPLSPKEVILKLREHLLLQGPKLLKNCGKTEAEVGSPDLVTEVMTEETLWQCTACGACQEECPVAIEHIDKIVDMRRHLVLERTTMPDTAERALRSIEDRGHPWRGTRLGRTTWAEGLGVRTLAQVGSADVLYWVGCTPALEEVSMRVPQAVVKILKAAEVNFAILGEEEVCCGELARRIGNEYLFQMQAEQVIGLLRGHGVHQIVTTCPHCFNTFKNEYPDFGGNFQVAHHTQFIAALLRSGRIQPSQPVEGVVAYHDACYLGRHNDIYQSPRDVLRRIPGLRMVEMERHARRSFCCGGGGGRFWMEDRVGRRINEFRLEQAMQTEAGIVATACPYCLCLFEDTVRTKELEGRLKIMDIAEFVAKALP
ncbi:MAG TPA: 4Fe-4S dicluster domain-containing protein [Dehalococcoidia bacterium]|nr:4Fe-4S dicluster domain-containing protein [Dehalococcoidia bacterium]